jgi:hypothetical protein
MTNKKKKKNKSMLGGLFNFLPKFFTQKEGSMVDNMKKGVKGYQGGSMGKGGMGK